MSTHLLNLIRYSKFTFETCNFAMLYYNTKRAKE